MPKIGVIYSAYNARDYVAASLAPWVHLMYRYGKMSMPVGHSSRPYSFVICAVNVRFAGFEAETEDGTRDLLRAYADRGDVRLIDAPDNVPETTARGMALQYLRDKVDAVWQVDADEHYAEADIHAILDYIAANPADWYRLSLKNYVFDESTYLIEPFTPPRIHRVNVRGYRAHSFSGDNDIQYGGTITRDIIPQDRFASLTIPASVANPRHFTWLSDDRSRRKCAYQWARWGNCSFVWDAAKGLMFNPAMPPPKVARDSGLTI